jgi:signal transduction histidine kinase
LPCFFAFALYAGARQFALSQMLGSRQLSTERTFELLYRAARQVQAQPSQYAQTLAQLLRELFEPLEVVAAKRVPARALVVAGGSALTVPLASGTALTLRFAQRGRRLFGHEDSRLADRVVEQLRRARAYDQAVEKGRTEERLRIAQDLHDDIGARLLTLMYQAPTPELEDYIRHTLQDLKTLTRGLAASEHLLSHAAAEWKGDLAQRLAAARAELVWSFSADEDLQLSVVQWSALTRVIRELVTNALFHGSATRIEVNLVLEQGQLKLQVLDDGKGQAPHTWAHGLGLGGVRKRVKLLGGEVRWTQELPSGILCAVTIPMSRPAAAPSG